MRTDDLVGAIWLPGDGKANPTDLTAALAKGARMRGRQVFEKTRVTSVATTERPRAAAWAVRPLTTTGHIETEYVVNCAGQWASAVGAMVGVTVPLHSAEHFYVVTEPFEGVQPDFPVMRDPDGYTYFKEEVGGLVVGGFEPEAKPWVSPYELPYPFEFQLLEEDWEHFSVLMDNALLRVPALETHRHPQVLQRAGVVHARQPVHPRRGARGRGLLRRRGVQLRRHRLGGRRGSCARGVGRRGRADQRPDRGRRTPLRRLQRQRALAARPRRRGARAALRDPVAQPRDAHGPALPPLAGAPPARRGQRRLRQQDGLGARQLLRAAGGVAGDRVLLGQAELAALGRRGAGEHAHRGDGLRPDVVLQVPAARARRRDLDAVAVHGRRRRARGSHRLHGDAEPTRHLRVRRDRDAHGRAGVPRRLQRRHHRARPGPHPPPPAVGCRRRPRRRHVVAGRLRGDGAVVARRCCHDSPTRTSPTTRSRSRPRR